ncbi:MAG: HAD family phosphatase [Oscillospiraceae bacterium]|nr:HAD family phosphatase [Oscillospiraceae bacterium]
MMGIRGAIFDVDGTLLDSMPIWDGVAADYLRSRGCLPSPGLNDELRKLGGHQIPQYFQREYGISETASEIHDAIGKLLEDFYYNTAPLKDGVAQVLESLQNKGVGMCVATATDRHLIEPALQRCGIIGYFGRIFTCSEEKTSKSSPDIYLRAADFLGTSISETLVFEDALYAIRSAKKAGFPIVAVYDKSADDQQDEIESLCDCYVKSLEDFCF